MRKSLLLSVELVFRVSVLLTGVNNHSPGSELGCLSFNRINDKCGKSPEQDSWTVTGTLGSLWSCALSFFPSSCFTLPLWVTIRVILKAFQTPCPPPSPAPPGLSSQWVSIRAWPSCRLATSTYMHVEQLWLGCGENRSLCWFPALLCSSFSQQGPAMGSNYR